MKWIGQNLFQSACGTVLACSVCLALLQVFLFGSVPLKTYLPDGDIDLTAVCPRNMEENIAREVFNALEDEAQDPNSQVKDVRFIEAQVYPDLLTKIIHFAIQQEKRDKEC